MKLQMTDKMKKFLIGGVTLALVGTLSGCSDDIFQYNEADKTYEDDNNYDTIDPNVKMDEANTDQDALENGFTQTLDVKDEDFKLNITYICDLENQENWTITSDKKLGMAINTSNLPEGYKVYIDNIHTDTTIIAVKPGFNGILQDTMDDRIHNSKIVGFPIDDSMSYYGINEIEGQNESFISGTMRGFGTYNNRYSYGEITQKRFLEENYLKEGVYGNKISSVVDLLIHKPGMAEDDYKAVSVSSDIVIKCADYVKKLNADGKEYYEKYVIQNNGKVQRQIVDSDNGKISKTR